MIVLEYSQREAHYGFYLKNGGKHEVTYRIENQ